MQPVRRALPTLIRLGWMASLVALGCATAAIPGPRLARVPPGFTLVLAAERSEPLLRGRPLLDQRAYVSSGSGEERIRLTTYSGTATRAEILEAREQSGRSDPRLVIGPLDPLAPDDTTGWGWRRLRLRDDKTVFREFIAVRNDPKRNRVYTVEYRVPPESPVREAAMKQTARDVRVDRNDVSYAKLGLAAGLLGTFALAVALGRRARG